MDRRRTAALIVGGVVGAALIGVVAGRQISSPAEQAARTRPPTGSPILVPVEERILSADVVTRGTGRFGSPRKLTVATSALKANPGFVADISPVGSQMDEGGALLTASGRPLFLLTGHQPLARDLGPGMSGDDVRQLEEALVRLGFDSGEADGMYDDTTQSAVSAWYEANGFSPFTATADQLATIRSREAELSAARLEILNAKDSVGTADAAVAAAESALTSAQNRVSFAIKAQQRARNSAAVNNLTAAADVTAKQAALDTLRSGSPLPARPSDIAIAQAELDTARANATSVGAVAARAVADAQAILDGAPAKLASATEAAVVADAAAAADVAAKQTTLDQLLADPASTASQIAIATADLAAAKANADNVRVTGAQAVAEATAVLNGAPAALAAARAESEAAVNAANADVAGRLAALSALTNPGPPTAADIAAAEADLATAKANASTTLLAGEEAVDQADAELANARIEVTVQRGALTAAENARSNAEGSLNERTAASELAQQEADLAHRGAGVQVPADEVVFVAVAPVRVSELLVATGDPAIGPVMSVTDSLVFVDSSLAVEDAALVKPGMTVSVDEASLGIATEGVVDFVAPAPGTNGVDGFHIYFQVSVADPPPNLVGASVRLTIPVESTGGAVLAVPLNALTMGPDGSSRVHVDTGSGLEIVGVMPGLSADGYVEITPTGGAGLSEGDLVLIGVDRQTTSSQNAGSRDPTAAGAQIG